MTGFRPRRKGVIIKTARPRRKRPVTLIARPREGGRPMGPFLQHSHNTET
jgi:hypothetical protein